MPDMTWLRAPAKALNDEAAAAAATRQGMLTKPPGALGRLETIAIELARQQGRVCPRLNRVHVCVFAGDHGVAEEGVSAFPQAVTVEMVRNFGRGGAAVSVLSKTQGASLEIIDLGCIADPGSVPGLKRYPLGPGTANFTRAAAMSDKQLEQALSIGREVIERAHDAGMELFVGGEMGIANTTAATAIACALLDAAPTDLVGAGTGLDAPGMAHKAEVIARGLQQHAASLHDPLAILGRLGGFEIAALCGAYLSAAQRGMPVLVDGFIATAAALVAVRINPSARPWMWFAHRSAERGHARLLAELNADPWLDLGMRLGEGSGAMVALPLMRLACDLHGGMATFAEAGVSEQPG
ncbi:MAG: nicotinate-nucleotide--dimethylbenzimidazole phosphoribosyltransferase [Gammaproteobacteria bacterium]|nr:nicotinate-nucleotide--dimethylbenzimidazole phosphoribosyltransferase [Gammaproteobacteria bacterium]